MRDLDWDLGRDLMGAQRRREEEGRVCSRSSHGQLMGATERSQELARQAIADDRESLLPFLRGQEPVRRLSPERSSQQPPESDLLDLQQALYVRERSNLRPRDRTELRRNPAGDAPYFSTGVLEAPGVVASAAMPVAQFSRTMFGPAFARTTSSNQLSLLQSLNQPVVCTDLRGNISFWNRAAEQFYQWKSEEVIGSSIVDLIIPPSLKKSTSETLLRIAQGESWSGQYPCVRRDGVMLNSVVTKTPLVDDDQKIIGILVLCVEGSVLSQGKSSIKRSYSDEGLSQTIEEEGVLEGFSLEESLKSLLVEQQPEADTTGRNLLKLGRSSVQQLLRKLHIGGGTRWEEDDSATPRQPERQNSWESEHEVANEFMQDRYRGSRASIASTIQNDAFQGTVASSADGVSLPLIMVGQGAGPYMMGRDVGVEDFHSDPGAGFGGFQVLSRTSCGSAANSVSGSPNIPSVQGSSAESNLHGVALLSGPARGVNFQQAEEDFQLQLALALRVAAEAAAVDDPDLSANRRGPVGSTRLMPGVTRVEATAYRYWVSNCLGYEDRIEDGFYEVWGMSPYVWSMCTDSNELGRMPPMESLRSVGPTEATFEVVLVDRNSDPDLKDLEERVVGLAYNSVEVSDLATKLAQMVANVMGGPAASDDELMEAWRVSSDKMTQRLQSIVLPIGMLRTGLSRHRALLFKVMADSVGLPCRLVRGSSYCDKQDDAMVVVKCGDDREWMVDLLAEPGHIMPPDARLSAPPTVIASPLQFERPTPFAGSSVSVLDWARNELGVRGGIAPGLQIAVTSEQAASSPIGIPLKPPATDAAKMGSGTLGSPRAQNLGPWRGGVPSPRGNVAPQPFDFTPLLFDQRNSASQIAKEREQEKADSLPRDKEQSRGGQGQGGSRYEEYHTGPSANQNQDLSKGRISGDVVSGGHLDDDTSGRANERGASSSQEEEISRFSRGKLVENAVAFAKEFEIPWEDLIIGERIGQGSYGKVYRADWQGSDVAVKVFLDQDLKMEALEEFKGEVAIMRRLRHPNVVLFMGAVTRPPNLSIITEFCPRGSLYRLLHRPNRELDQRRCVRMALDVVKGMNYLHRSSPPVVHRDLKSPNLLVDKNWTVKVCDFGLSRLKHSTFLTSKSSAGTPEWMAPEVLRNELSDEKSDVYSFGVILWELATLQQPWAGMNPIQVVGAVGFQHRRLPIPESVDPSIANIIQACWRMDPRQRPSFSDIMQELKPLTRPAAGGGQQPAGQKPSSPSDMGLD